MALSNFVKRLQDIMRNDAGINGDAQRIEQMTWILFLKVYEACIPDGFLFTQCQSSHKKETARKRRQNQEGQNGILYLQRCLSSHNRNYAIKRK